MAASLQDALDILTDEGFAVCVQPGTRDASLAHADALKQQPDDYFRSAVLLKTTEDGRRFLKEKWEDRFKGHFWVEYGDGPSYAGAVMHPDDIDTRDKLVAKLAKLKKAITRGC